MDQTIAPPAINPGIDYGPEEAAMQAYLREGEKRAFALGNRGPIRFTATGELHPDIVEAYWRCGFYVFEGVLDFYNSAAASIQLPAGYSATTSSGLPLVFAPVPEPSLTALLAAGLVLVLLTPRLRAKASGLRKAQA